MNFSQFVNKKNVRLNNLSVFNEAFKNSDMVKAQNDIVSILRKQTGLKIVSLGYFDTTIGDEDFKSELFICGEKNKKICFTFNWSIDTDSSEVYSISFFKDMSTFIDGTGKSELTINTLGSSIVYFIPVVSYIAKTEDYSLSIADMRKQMSNIKESSLYIGALKHLVYENMSCEVVKNTFKLNQDIFEETDYEKMKAWKSQKYKEAQDAHAKRNESPEANRKSKDLWAEYDAIKAAVKGGAGSINEVKMAIQKSQRVIVRMSDSEQKIQDEIESAGKDPEQVFKEMYKYISMIGDGTTPSLIICGAPGCGKTWKTQKQLSKMGYVEDENLCTIKGKCSTAMIYRLLYKFRNKHNVIVIDDADGLVGPKAPEDVINILKAALDSTGTEQGRLVSYSVAGKILDEEGQEIPKKMYYNGGIIILTNYNAGQLNTALRGRSYVQDIHFSAQQMLDIIKKLMPALDPEHLSMEAKLKAYDYLMELYNNGEDFQLSMRTFNLSAQMFQSNMNDSEFTDEDTKSMIKEQMINQSLRGGKSY